MSGKEPDPLAVMAGVKRQELTLVKASDLLGLGYRQTKGAWRRDWEDGNIGLVH